MKIHETLTSEEWSSLYNGTVEGIFKYLITDEDPFYDERYGLCLTYYTARSYSKTITSTYSKIIESTNAQDAFRLIANIIRNKYIDKWNRVYDTLSEKQYNALDTREETRHTVGDNTHTTEYNSTTTDDGNVGTRITSTRNDGDKNKLYGFNSTSAVNVNESEGQSTDIVSGDKNENTNHNSRAKTGDDTTTYDVDETVTWNGRDVPAAKLINMELDMRSKRLFYDIVYSDIDSIIALSIYI